MTKTIEQYVRCRKCDKGHLATPEPRDHQDKDGKTVFGVAVEDYTYYMDNFKDQGYHPICKSHDRDAISIVPERKLYLND